MNNIATTIVQSKHLLELGLDPKTADMVWMSDKWLYSIKDNILDKEDFREMDTLAWSLSALLEVIPKEELIDLSVSKDNYWFCSGVHFDTSMYNNPIDAAYAQVKWLLEQGLIKKGEQDGQ